jgi:hypothetical protein
MRSTVSPVTNEEKNNVAIQRQMQHYTAPMESIIGNFSNSTQTKYDSCGDDPYSNIFEQDDLDDEDVEPQEVDENGNIIL